jgi:4-oxalocrotonate tautomerase
MPIVTVGLNPGRSKEIKAKLAAGITDLLVEVAGGTRANCIVLFHETAKDDWAIGGRLVSDPDHPAAKRQP